MFVYYPPPRPRPAVCSFKDPACLSVLNELDGGGRGKEKVEHVPLCVGGRTRGRDSARKTGGALIRQGIRVRFSSILTNSVLFPWSYPKGPP